MYNIGLLHLNNKANSSTDSEVLKRSYNVIEITENIESIEELQAVIIEEEVVADISTICEMILKIKQRSNCYIWVFTATENSVGKLVYLQLGADEVFGADREVKEVGLVIENALCRIASQKIESHSVEIPLDKKEIFELNPSNISVFIDGEKEVVLTKLEYQIFEVLLKTPNTAVTYETIFQKIWKDDSIENKQYRVANVVYHLRRKIEKNIKKPKFIKTVRSKGYMLSV